MYLQKTHGFEERLKTIVFLPYIGAGAPSARLRGDIAASDHNDVQQAHRLPLYLAADEICWRSTPGPRGSNDLDGGAAVTAPSRSSGNDRQGYTGGTPGH
jgi:hypothetical protein